MNVGGDVARQCACRGKSDSFTELTRTQGTCIL